MRPDRTLALLRDGYHFRDRIHPDADRTATAADRSPGTAQPDADVPVEIRLLGRRALVVGGSEGVRLFYDDERMCRRKATPAPLAHELFGRGAVHGLDDADHRHRKNLFLEATEPSTVRALAEAVAAGWERVLDRATGGRLNVFDRAVEVIGVAVLTWAGLPGTAHDLRRQAHDLAAVVDGFGSAGARHLRGRRARRRCERWAAAAIRTVRQSPPDAPTCVLERVATHHDRDGKLLGERTAAVELLNVVRPTVAVAWMVAFAALELGRSPQWRQRIVDEDQTFSIHQRPIDAPPGTTSRLIIGTAGPVALAFANEVRRTTPFVPVLAARARSTFTWRGHRIRTGQRVILDVHGTNRRPVDWPSPEEFDPGRFLTEPARAVADTFVPQGGGPLQSGHRCPGEGITTSVLAVMTVGLARRPWTLPAQDADVPLRRMPTRPRSGVVLDLPAPVG